MTRDRLEDAFLRLRAAADADEYVPMEDVIEVVLDLLAHAEDVQNGDDAASRIAERVMREVRKEFEDLMEAQEAEHRRQMVNKERRHAEEKQHLRDQLHDALAENERLRAAAEEVLSWNTGDTSTLLSNPPQNAGLFRAQCVLRAALEKKP
jgi:vacuolar-type H+-ATPase subunit I/STV1